MGQLRSLVDRVEQAAPPRIGRSVRAAHRDYLFRRAMRRFLEAPGACARPGHPVLLDLIYGWGNEGFSALDDYLAVCVKHAMSSPGPILECGSGLSTILVGAVAKERGQSHWALEHKSEWAARVQRDLTRYQLDSVRLCAKPLKDHGEFCWYDPPLESMPDRFSLVVCDGPPGRTKGGRYGLVPIMRERLQPGCVILLDDAGRDQELAIARSWEAELDASVETPGSARPYIQMTVGNAPRRGDERGTASGESGD